MKTFKKIGCLLAIALAALVSISLFHGRALAAVAQGDIAGGTYKFQDRANIIGDFSASGQVTFTDNNPTDSTRNYVPDAGAFCDPGTIPDQNGVKGNIRFGININSGADLTAASISAQVKLGYSVGNNCTGVLEKVSITNPQNPVPVAAATFEWDGTEITSFPGDGRNITFTQTANSDIVYFSSNSTGNCPEDQAIVLTNGTNQGTYYHLIGIVTGGTRGQTSNLSNYPLLNNTNTVDTSKCSVDTTNPPLNITISGTQDKQAAGGGNVAQADDPCTATGFSLSWLICPTFQAADKFSQVTINLFEKQLSFRISDLNATGRQDKVKLSWSIIRDISSALLVIILLIMVISQAMGGGVFEAYTVRKLLPKLIVAVILIQLSWTLLAYVVGVFDDIGHGLKDILYLPFQGANLDNFGALLGNAGVGTGLAAAFSWTAVIGLAIGISIGLPALLGFVFAAVLADLTGLAVLIFRKIIILMALLLAPLAILCWILPGTESYYKMWRENLMKSLMMYPLVIGIVAAGRIFAYVIGSTRGDEFLNFFLVTVAFFGPLFILPKTYKWGGTAMRAIGEQTFKASERYLTGKEAKPMQYFNKRQEELTNERRRQSQERMALKEEYGKYSKSWRYPLDRFRAGSWDPLKGMPGSRRRFESVSQYQAAGRESSGKTYEAAKAASQQILDNAADHDGVTRDLMRGIPFDWYDKKGHLHHFDPPKGAGTAFMRAAGAAGINKYGTDGSNGVFQAELDRMRADPKTALLAEEILDENVQGMKPKMDSMYRGFDRAAYQRVMDSTPESDPERQRKAIRAARRESFKSSIKSMKPTWFNGMEGVEAESDLAGLSQAIADGDPEAPQLMKKLWRDYKAARENPNIDISPGVHKAFKAYADGTGLDNIIRARKAETTTRIRGDITHEDGTVEKIDKTIPLTDRNDVLDVIKNDDAANQRIIREVGGRELMKDYDETGSPKTEPDSSGSGGGGGGRDPGYRPQYREATYVDSPEGGRVFYQNPVAQPVMPSEFGETEYGAAPRYAPTAVVAPPAQAAAAAQPVATTAEAAPVVYDSGSEGGGYAPRSARNVERVTERTVREVSPTVIAPTTTVVQAAGGEGAQTVYSRVPEAAPASASAPIDQHIGEELLYQQRNLFRELKRLGTSVRDQQQQQQFEQLKSQHPDWDNEDSSAPPQAG